MSYKKPLSAWKDLFLHGELHLTPWCAHDEAAAISAIILSMWKAFRGEGWILGHGVCNTDPQLRMKNFIYWFFSLFHLVDIFIISFPRLCYQQSLNTARKEEKGLWECVCPPDHCWGIQVEEAAAKVGKGIPEDVKCQKPGVRLFCVWSGPGDLASVPWDLEHRAFLHQHFFLWYASPDFCADDL